MLFINYLRVQIQVSDYFFFEKKNLLRFLTLHVYRRAKKEEGENVVKYEKHYEILVFKLSSQIKLYHLKVENVHLRYESYILDIDLSVFCGNN